MSAYIVEDDVLILLAVYAGGRNGREYRTHRAVVENNLYGSDQLEIAKAFIKILLNENLRSVNNRYSSNEKIQTPFIHIKHLQHTENSVTASKISKACDYYEYQACECDDYFQTKAATIINCIRKSLLENLINKDESWGFNFPADLIKSASIVNEVSNRLMHGNNEQ